MIDSIAIVKVKGLYFDNLSEVRTTDQHGHVYLRIADKVCEMTTSVATKIGVALVTKAGELLPGEFLQLVINGNRFNVLSLPARRLGGALLRRADRADDWQRAHTKMELNA